MENKQQRGGTVKISYVGGCPTNVKCKQCKKQKTCGVSLHSVMVKKKS